MVKKMFTEIRLCNQMTYFPVNTKYMHKHNVIFNKTVTKLVTILTKCFFPYLNPTSYLNIEIGKFSAVGRCQTSMMQLFCENS